MTVNFDLLGDPIPENFGKRGRPPHMVTPEKRNKVMMLLAVGWSNERISGALGITPPTLRKVYFRELKARDAARDRVDAELMSRLRELGAEGNVAAIKELAKQIERQDLLGVRFKGQPELDAKPKKAPKLGKKEQALAEALAPNDETPAGRAAARRAGKQPRLVN